MKDLDGLLLGGFEKSECAKMDQVVLVLLKEYQGVFETCRGGRGQNFTRREVGLNDTRGHCSQIVVALFRCLCGSQG